MKVNLNSAYMLKEWINSSDWVVNILLLLLLI